MHLPTLQEVIHFPVFGLGLPAGCPLEHGPYSLVFNRDLYYGSRGFPQRLVADFNDSDSMGCHGTKQVQALAILALFSSGQDEGESFVGWVL